MPKSKPTWERETEWKQDYPKVEPIPERMCKRWDTGTIAIPAPSEVDAFMRQVPKNLSTRNTRWS